MITAMMKLDTKERADVEALITICEKFDGASTCIQLDHSLNFRKDRKSWFLLYENGDLVGISSVFAPMEYEAEISLCVKPDARRRGVGKRLLEATSEELDLLNAQSRLLVVDKVSKAGMEFVDGIKLPRHHTEYAMTYACRKNRPSSYFLTFREGRESDIERIVTICASAFDDDYETAATFIHSSFGCDNRKSYVALAGDRIVGTCFLGFEDGTISINTVAVAKEDQGKGFGRELIHRVLGSIENGGKRICIDVDSDNERAHTLYEKIGFTQTEAVDYFQMGKEP